MDRKEQILFDSFNILKDDVKTNHEQLAKILSQLQGNQPNTVIDLWKYLLEANWSHVLRDKEEYHSICAYLTSDMMHELTKDRGFNEFENYFVTEPKIIKAVYRYAPNLPPWTTCVIGTQIRQKQWENANKMLECMFANKKNEFKKTDDLCNYCYSEIFKNIIEKYVTTTLEYGCSVFQSGVKPPKEAFDFLSYWVDKIEDQEERARTNVVLAELI